MNTVLMVLLFVLKVLGIVLLAVLALVLLVCLLPIGAAVDYRPDALRVQAVLGPVRLQAYPRGGEEAAKPEPEKTKAAPPPEAPKTEAPAKAAPPPKKTQPPKPAVPEPPPDAAKAPEKPAEPEKTEKPPKPSLGERFMTAVRRDPVLFIEDTLTHAIFAGGRLLHGIHVRGLTVFWTVTGKEASDTSVQFGALMAAANNLLTRAKAYLDIRPEELWLEPDFTGERQAERHVACVVTMRPIVLVLLAPRLLWRFLRDPAYKGILF